MNGKTAVEIKIRRHIVNKESINQFLAFPTLCVRALVCLGGSSNLPGFDF